MQCSFFIWAIGLGLGEFRHRRGGAPTAPVDLNQIACRTVPASELVQSRGPICVGSGACVAFASARELWCIDDSTIQLTVACGLAWELRVQTTLPTV
jgi:hypothetical protein